MRASSNFDFRPSSVIYALLILTSLNVVVRSSVILKAFGPLPNVQLLMHSQKVVDKTIKRKREAQFNHQFAGASCTDAEAPKSFRILNESLIVGHGLKDFHRASTFMFSFEMVNQMPWANVVISSDTEKASITVGTVLCTLIKCYRSVWTLNPVRICHISRTSEDEKILGKGASRLREGAKLVDQIAYSTIDGHLISGEERFRVSLMSNDDVVFDIYSFTKGAGAIGTIAMPFIRPIQGAFFRDVTLCMQKIMNSGKSL